MSTLSRPKTRIYRKIRFSSERVVKWGRRLMLSKHALSADIVSGILAYFLTSVGVWLGILLGINLGYGSEEQPFVSTPEFITACSRWDANHYRQIVKRGYVYDPSQPSRIAFFPLYPLTARLVVKLTGFSTPAALLLVSNLMLLVAFILLSLYIRSVSGHSGAPDKLLVLALVGVWPAGLFFRMGYSESTFLALTTMVLLAMARGWPLLVVAVFAGLATAVRPVGIAVTAGYLANIFSQRNRGSLRRRLLLATCTFPVACCGLLAYMVYQYAAFGDPLAFAKTQDHWHLVSAAYYGRAHKVEALLTAEPVWAIYVPGRVGNWQQLNPKDYWVFNIFFWNPIFFVGTVALVLVGCFKAWLTAPEIVLGCGLLVIPYVTRAYEMSMASEARFAAVVVPAYMVLGRLLQAVPEWLRWLTLILLSMTLMAWSEGYPFRDLFIRVWENLRRWIVPGPAAAPVIIPTG